MPKVIVTFEKNWRGYAAGETAGFDSVVADSLIASGYACEAGKKGAKAAKPGASTAAPPAKNAQATSDSDATARSGAQADSDGKP